jgi:hypothetical protein
MKLKGKAKAAFLRRMARGRNKHKHTATKKHRKHKKERHVAKRHHSKKKKSHKGRRHHASISKWLPDQHKLVGMGTAFAYGKVEAAASKDTAHALNKVPPIVGQIGRAGNLGAIIWVISRVVKHPVVTDIASGVLHVAAYQNGRGGGFTKDAPDFKMGAPHRPGRGRDELLVEQYLNQRNRQG